jgi:hypothetical protein
MSAGRQNKRTKAGNPKNSAALLAVLRPSFLLLASFLIILATGTSCSVKAVKTAVPVRTPDADYLLARLGVYNNAVQRIDGKALVVYREADRTFSFRVVVAVDKPATRMRLDISDFVFKVPLYTLIRSGEDVLLVNHAKKTVSVLRDDDIDVRSLIGLDLPQGFPLDALLGEVFLIEGEGHSIEALDPVVLHINGGEADETVTFSQDLTPEKVRYTSSGQSIFVGFSKYVRVHGEPFPKKISLQKSGTTLDITYTELRLNTAIPDTVFSLQGETAGFTTIQ